MALPLKTLAQLATARHGFEALELKQDPLLLRNALHANVDICTILSSLVQQRTMLEAEVSRLGFKVTQLTDTLSREVNRNLSLEARIVEILER